MSRLRTSARLACVWLMSVSLIGIAGAGLATASAQTRNADDTWILAVPKRRPPDAPPSAPPSLPATASDVTPSTIHIVVRRDTKLRPSHTVRQIFSRTAERIHIAGNDGREWLFERNPIDPRRVSATLVDHAPQAIVLYEETDLRMVLGIRGWTDVLALGFDSQLLSDYTRTSDSRTIGGIRFARYIGSGKRAPLDEVWWSAEQALASRYAITDGAGATRFAVERIHAGAEAALLRPPATRFPNYRIYDLAGWLERH